MSAQSPEPSSPQAKPQRLVVGITGASGVILGIRLLEVLRPMPVETHLVLSPAGRATIAQETDWKVSDVLDLADVSYSHADIGAAIASGSFTTLGMVVIPCSIKTLSAVANSLRRRPAGARGGCDAERGAPAAAGGARDAAAPRPPAPDEPGSRGGAVIFPPVPAFYTRPQSLEEMVDNTVGRVLARLGIENAGYQEWQGMGDQCGFAAQTARKTALRTMSVKDSAISELLQLATMTIATTGAEGEAHAAAVYFAAGEDLQLYFFSAADSQHSLDLKRRPDAAAAIYPEVSGWQAIRGLQLRGRAAVVPSGAEWQAAWALYAGKFPFVKALKSIVASNELYAFTPHWLRLVDNRRGFGFKREWDLP